MTTRTHLPCQPERGILGHIFHLPRSKARLSFSAISAQGGERSDNPASPEHNATAASHHTCSQPSPLTVQRKASSTSSAQSQQEDHCKSIEKASQSLGKLRVKVPQQKGIPQATKLEIYRDIVLSSLLML
ncbi:hypothetical protein RRG08_013792 [Elysia crispata]|uniref:Uncharacterized protein n=1 Tax=Elysia crispata TaxID=231223 RepID=A0AAE1BC08_9GAST|nr:hypothetical protein RRG08_013792 [Elysia crispata]